MRFLHSSLFLALLLLAGSGWGAPAELIVQSRAVRPSPAQLAQWNEAYWQTEEEVWAFPDRREAETVICHPDVPTELQDGLFSTAFEMTAEERNKFGWQGNYQTNYLLKIPPSLRDQLPAKLVRRYLVYHRLEMRSRTVASWNVSGESTWAGLVEAQRRRLPDDVFQRFLRSSIQDDGVHRVLITPYSWKALPIEAKAHFLGTKFRDSPFREGLDLKVMVGREGPEAVASWLSPSGRYAQEIARKVRERSDKREIALEEILPDVVKLNLDRYSEGHGPDCFGLAKAFAQGTTQIEAIDSGAELVRALSAQGYSPVARGVPLELGDILYYEDGRNGGIHASVYIAEGIVFTKNGSSRTYPALFQYRDVNEILYSTDRRFRLTVFRLAEAEPTVLANPYYYAHPLEEFSHLFLDARSGRWARSGALALIGLHRLSEKAEADLRRYAVDPRYADTRKQAEAILRTHDAVVSHEPVTRRLKFHAYEAGPLNFEALNSLAAQDSLSPDEQRFVEWVAEQWPFLHRRELAAISKKHGLEIPPFGLCRLVTSVLGSLF